jgi:C-terminal processing protease CtpA/Prc
MRPQLVGHPPMLLPGNFGYIEVYGVPDSRTFDSALVAFKDTRGLILDFRYPRLGWLTSTSYYLASRFVDTPFVSARVQLPMLTMYRGPGGRGWYEQLNSKAPFRERGAPHYFQPIVAITNEFAQSTGETIPNFLRASGRATFVGSETEGTNGGAPDFSLPGGGYMVFTHERVLNPDGSEFQGVGIVPDVYVEPTVEGVRAGRDEVLERAIQVLRTRVSAPKK